MNLPNKLTISRMVMIPIFIALFYVQFTGHYFVALAVFAIACLTDLLDGKIARKYNLVTNLGKFLDPIADKVLVLSALVVMLTKPEIFTENANFGNWAIIIAGCGVALILAREIIVSGFRMVAASTGMVIAADIFGKYKTTAQDIAIVILLIGAGVCEICDHIAGTIINYIGLGFFAISVILTVISGINYLVKNREVLKA
ncbi:MAG: CDP-diacylglycerol--glycerol-3-phosphate 3-phosphatidyltransferase [Clostridiales bacterium]|nr:CDP-diacylglycerol--glycerol-3-phosphate 3-phosphatidyltransferase [Clostridiales bacterium]